MKQGGIKRSALMSRKAIKLAHYKNADCSHNKNLQK